MERTRNLRERRKHHRVGVCLPLEYWETSDSSHGGLIDNVSESGLLIYSTQDMPIGTELRIRVFFNFGYEFENFDVFAKIAWKTLQNEVDGSRYRYGLEFIQISQADQQNLVKLLNNRFSQATDLHKTAFQRP